MPRYLIHRKLGKVTDEKLAAAAVNAKRVREADFPDITWEHTHVIRSAGGLATYCVYESPDEERIRAHARASELPVDEIWELVGDVDPAEL